MEVLKQSSPTLRPSAPSPWPQNTEPSASTRAAVAAVGRGGGSWLIPSALGVPLALRPRLTCALVSRDKRAAGARVNREDGDRAGLRALSRPGQARIPPDFSRNSMIRNHRRQIAIIG